MTRLIIHVEGPTEDRFVKEVLAPHLYRFGYTTVAARILGNARLRKNRGGIIKWASARKDILNHLKEDSRRSVTTMVDYYALPSDWLGHDVSHMGASSDKAEAIEAALLKDISESMGDSFNPNRFVPYVMMHEFEAMLFSDCERFGQAIAHTELIPSFQAIRNQFTTPEDIDDSPETAPSKRIEQLIRGYNKPLMGNLAILDIGIDSIRRECPHFGEWMEKLERLPII